MQSILFERWTFIAVWFQKEAHLKRQFILNYFPYDNGVEMFDRNTSKTFLRRCIVPGLNQNSFYLNAKVNIFGRQIVLTEYGDESTRTKLSCNQEKAFCLILPKSACRLSEIMKILLDSGFTLGRCAMVELSRQQSIDFVDNVIVGGTNGNFSGDLAIGPSVAIELSKRDAINSLKSLVTGAERVTDGDCTNRKFRTDVLTNKAYYADSGEIVSKALRFFFSTDDEYNRARLAVSYENTTICLIKPHAVRDGKTADILVKIAESGFVIKGMSTFELCQEQSEEFYEVYKGVVADFVPMAIELSNGPFIALEIGLADPAVHAHETFRELCGPRDPEVARKIRPMTLRAQFGVNLVQNAVHCTDLKEDCSLELEYFFKILSK